MSAERAAAAGAAARRQLDEAAERAAELEEVGTKYVADAKYLHARYIAMLSEYLHVYSIAGRPALEYQGRSPAT